MRCLVCGRHGWDLSHRCANQHVNKPPPFPEREEERGNAEKAPIVVIRGNHRVRVSGHRERARTNWSTCFSPRLAPAGLKR
jgi:hypothetical protein